MFGEKGTKLNTQKWTQKVYANLFNDGWNIF